MVIKHQSSQVSYRLKEQFKHHQLQLNQKLKVEFKVELKVDFKVELKVEFKLEFKVEFIIEPINILDFLNKRYFNNEEFDYNMIIYDKNLKNYCIVKILLIF